MKYNFQQNAMSQLFTKGLTQTAVFPKLRASGILIRGLIQSYKCLSTISFGPPNTVNKINVQITG